MAVLLALGVASSTSWLAGPPPASAEPHQATFEDVPGNYSDWMKWIPDTTSLTELSLPATHDSATHEVLLGNACVTQSMDFTEQLDAGIRVLDIRASRQGTETAPRLEVDHGSCNLGVDFNEIAVDVAKWVKEHSTETVIVRIGGNGLSSPAGSPSYNTALEYILDSYDVGADPLRTHVWTPAASSTTVPTLADVRGKIVLLRGTAGWGGYDKDTKTYPAGTGGYPFGPNWADGLSLPCNAVRYDSLTATTSGCEPGFEDPAYYNVEITCEFADGTIDDEDGDGGDGYCMQHTVKLATDHVKVAATDISTGTTKFVASGFEVSGGRGPGDGSDFVNLELYRFLASYSDLECPDLCTDEIGSFAGAATGIVWTDFPGGGLIGAIVAHNLRLIDRPAVSFEGGTWKWNWPIPSEQVSSLLQDLFNATAEGLDQPGDEETKDRATQFERTLKRLLPNVDMIVGVQRYDSDEVGRVNPILGWPALGRSVVVDDEWLITWAIHPAGSPAATVNPDLVEELVMSAAGSSTDTSLTGRAVNVRRILNTRFPRYTWGVTASELDNGGENRWFSTSNSSTLPFVITGELPHGYSYFAYGIRLDWGSSPVSNVLLEATGPAHSTPDAVVEYELTARSVGGAPVTGVQLTETVPVGARFDAANSDPGWSCVDGAAARSICTLDVGDLPAKTGVATRSFAVRTDALVSRAPGGLTDWLANTASVSAAGGDVNVYDNNVFVSTKIDTTVDLAVAIDVIDRPADRALREYDRVTFAVAASNAGNRAEDAQLTVTLPEDWTADELASDARWSCRTDIFNVVCTAEVFQVSSPRVLTLSAIVNRTPLGDVVVVPAEINEPFGDLNPADNTTSARIAQFADVTLEKRHPAGDVDPRDVIDYDIVVGNVGFDLSTTTITELVPAGTTPTAATLGIWNCASGRCVHSTGRLRSGTTIEVPFAVTVDLPVPVDLAQVSNTAWVDLPATIVDRNLENNSETVMNDLLAGIDLMVGITPTTAPVVAGAPLMYEVHFDNIGTRAAGAAIVELVVPQHTTFNLADSFGWICPAGVQAGATCSLSVPDIEISTGIAPIAVDVDSTAGPANPIVARVDIQPVDLTEIDLDPDNNTAEVTTVVGNSPPSNLSLFTDPGTAPEGTPVVIYVEFTDATVDDPICEIDPGDGSGPQVVSAVSGVSGVNGLTVLTCSLTHHYGDDASYAVVASVNDGFGSSDQTAIALVITNEDPLVFGVDSVEVVEGDLLTGLMVPFNDFGSMDTHEATVRWGTDEFPAPVVRDVVGPPGVPAGLIGTIEPIDHLFVDDFAGTWEACVQDDDGGDDCVQAPLSVVNAAPVIVEASLSQTSIVEGEMVQASVIFYDPGEADTFEVKLDWGDGVVVDTTAAVWLGDGFWSVDVERLWLDDDPTGTPTDQFNVTASVLDDDGGQSGDEVVGVVTVANGAPADIQFALSSTFVDENETVTLNGTFTDPSGAGAVGDDFMVEIDWGDGSATDLAVVSGAAPRAFSGSHQYLDDGSYEVEVRVTDDDTGVGTVRDTVEVANVAPVLTGAIGPVEPVQYSDPWVGAIAVVATDVAGYVAAPESLMASATFGPAASPEGPLPMVLAVGDPTCTSLPPGDLVVAPRQECTWSIEPQPLLVNPGGYIIRVVVADDDGGSTSVDVPLEVVAEDARVEFTGGGVDGGVTSAVSGRLAESAGHVVTLSAIVRDVSAVAGDPDSDPWPGDVRTATVTFVDRTAGDAVLCEVPAVEIAGGDATVGSATCDWAPPAGAGDVTVGVVVGGAYQRNATADDVVVAAAPPPGDGSTTTTTAPTTTAPTTTLPGPSTGSPTTTSTTPAGTAPTTSVGPSGVLPTTGSDGPHQFVWIALLLTLLGAVVLGGTRRSRQIFNRR